MAEITFKPPSEKAVNFLYDGIVAFYPDIAKEVFRLGKTTLPFHEAWGGFRRLDFLDFALNTTLSETIEQAASIVRAWKEEGLPERTIPERLDELVAQLEEEDQKEKVATPTETYRRQKLVKDALLESQRAREAAEAAAAVPPTESEPSPGEEVVPPETASLGIKITPETGKALGRFANRIISAPFRLAVGWAYPTVAKEQGETPAAALALWSKGITSKAFEEKASTLQASLETKEAKRIETLIRAIRGLETGYPLQTRLLQLSFPIRDITFLLGPESGLTQAQIVLFFYPPQEGGFVVESRQSFFGNIINQAGRQLFGKLSKKAIKGLVARAASSAGVGAAGTAVGAEVGAAAGVTAGAAAGAGAATGAGVGAAAGGPLAPITAIVGAVIGWLASKIPDAVSWLKRHAKEFGIAAIALLATGIFFGNPIVIFLGVGAGIVSLGAGGLSTIGTSVAGFAQGTMAVFTSLVVPTVGTPILITLLVIPAAIAIILFIINSGAYIVPPRPGFLPGAIESPYIGIEKTATPECMHRSGCPGFGPVTYRVKIWAKKGTLTNIRITNEYRVISSRNLTIAPPAVAEITTPPTLISPTTPLEFTYTLNITSAYDDSIITDNLTVTADAPEQRGAVASQSASVVIGNPPISCPLPGGTSEPRHWSYYPGNESAGHGSNDYWQRMGGVPCDYSLPQRASCFGPTNSGNVCSGRSSVCDFYGFAMDAWPSGSNQVLAPTVRGQPVTWSYDGGFSNPDSGLTYIYRSGTYYLVLTHLSSGGNTSGAIPSGATIGQLFPQGSNTHLHIEFQVSGRYVRPEEYFCR